MAGGHCQWWCSWWASDVPPYIGLPASLASLADLLIIASGLGLAVDVIKSGNDRWAVVVEKRNGGGSREEKQQQQWW
ncbi:hypothetical protein BDQ12DRAFT_720552 [Crucibulum laeve]|uniref:Uncharacterized protein n=1 Tax=Crucibulum laeve TaxID=68775 RepID=A0A5C3M8Z2_9AGAR|nr:hypothetical protein BDQ12DRAFT_720552 [Crucibulum laeve]